MTELYWVGVVLVGLGRGIPSARAQHPHEDLPFYLLWGAGYGLLWPLFALIALIRLAYHARRQEISR